MGGRHEHTRGLNARKIGFRGKVVEDWAAVDKPIQIEGQANSPGNRCRHSAASVGYRSEAAHANCDQMDTQIREGARPEPD